MRRLNVVSPREDAGVELYPIEEWVRRHPDPRAPPTTLPVLRDIEPHCLMKCSDFPGTLYSLENPTNPTLRVEVVD